MKRDYMGNDQLLPGYNIQFGICDEYIAVYDVKQYASDMVFYGQLLDCTANFVLLIYNACPTKNNYAPKICSIFLWNNEILIYYAKGYFITIFDRIEFVTAFCTVKIQRAAIINIAERDCVGIAVVAENGKNAGCVFH